MGIGAGVAAGAGLWVGYGVAVGAVVGAAATVADTRGSPVASISGAGVGAAADSAASTIACTVASRSGAAVGPCVGLSPAQAARSANDSTLIIKSRFVELTIRIVALRRPYFARALCRLPRPAPVYLPLGSSVAAYDTPSRVDMGNVGLRQRSTLLKPAEWALRQHPGPFHSSVIPPSVIPTFRLSRESGNPLRPAI